MEAKEITEKRQHKRFQVKEGAFVIPMAQSRRLWQIMDISKGGLSFHYVANGEKPEGSCYMDIVFSSDAYCLEKLPFNAVSDVETCHKTPISSLPIRRCSVQFGELTHGQSTQLDYFIHNHARKGRK